MNKETRAALRLSLLYAIAGILWIFLTDQLAQVQVAILEQLSLLQTYKGWLFVTITTILLFILTYREFNRRGRGEEELRRANRAYRTLSGCNQAVVRAEDEIELLQQVCRIIVEVGDYRLAWVGFARQGEEKTVEPVAWAGVDEGYLDSITVTWDESKHGRGPTGQAIRSGRTSLMRHIATDPAYIPWRPYALEGGFASSVALPLMVDRQAVGALNVYTAEADGFDTKELDLLEEMAGDIGYGISTLRTREARAQAEAQIRKLSQAVKQSPVSIMIAAPDGSIEYVNPKFTEMSGYRPDEAIGQNPRILKSGHTPDEVYGQLWETISAGKIWQGEFQNRRKDGSLYWVAASISPIKDADGDITGYVGVEEDITEIKQAEEALRASELRYRRVFEAAKDGILILDPETGQIVDANPFLIDLLDYSHEEFLGKKIWEIGTFKNIIASRSAFTDLVKSGYIRYEDLPLETKGGKHIAVEFVSNVYDEGQKSVIQCNIRDITERKQMEQAEREQRQFAEALVDIASTINSTLDLDEVFNRILTNCGRVVPHDASEIWLVDEEGVARVVACQGYAERGSEDALRALRLPVDETANMQKAAETGQPVIIDNASQYPRWVESETTDWVRSMVTVPVQVEDKIIGFLNLVSEEAAFFSAAHSRRLQAFADQAATAIHNARLFQELENYNSILEQAVEERTAELRAANEQLKELDRVKDTFLSTAAHELRTPLTSIQGFSEILLTRELEEDRQQRYLTLINEQSTQLARILDDLLDLSRLEAGMGLDIHPESVEMGKLVDNVIQSFMNTSPEHEIRVEGFDNLPPVQGDPFRLTQVLRNLVSNAVKYSPEGSVITLRGQTGADFLKVSVEDEGIGMSTEEQRHAFDKFYRANASSTTVSGTGLGLAICKLIIDQHGGEIQVSSEPGTGSTFTFTLPLEPNSENLKE